MARRALAPDVAADRTDARAARCRVEREPAADRRAGEVAARNLRVDLALDLVEPAVAGAAAECQRADAPRDVQVGGARVAGDERAERHRQVHAKLGAPPAEQLAAFPVLDHQTVPGPAERRRTRSGSRRGLRSPRMESCVCDVSSARIRTRAGGDADLQLQEAGCFEGLFHGAIPSFLVVVCVLVGV